ncbi:DUF6925 family protein [Methylobacterium sp. Leaf118]|uniref:DUF6925 family protein n=1 Tax=Methylobacterium sp. Leaf118 TaxID=2876562 RepID=UPI001E628924|nr:hypothetical protein [Methylobacterium sp. Leaf118]
MTRDTGPHAVASLLAGALADPDTAWSFNSFGALAGFERPAAEPAWPLSDGRMGLVTARGAIVLTPGAELRPFAYETGVDGGWNHAVALCLPETACAMSRRRVVTELGPDTAAARPEDRHALLFDLGLDLLAIDACLRVSDPEAIAVLRAGVGRPLFDAGNPIGPSLAALAPPPGNRSPDASRDLWGASALLRAPASPRAAATSPHRVFLTRIGRIEVFTPIPEPGALRGEGPHSHILPQLLKGGRTHAATAPIPTGLVPCGALHPPHPYKDRLGRRIPFDPARHAAFQSLLERWGDPELLAIKRVGRQGPASAVAPRHARGARRVAEAQARYWSGEAEPTLGSQAR